MEKLDQIKYFDTKTLSRVQTADFFKFMVVFLI